MTESWIKKKTADKKFYGYTGPVKPEKKRSSKWIAKKTNTSYGYSGKPTEVKNRSSWINKKS